MKIRRIDHVGIIVDDLAAAKAFFRDLGLAVLGEGDLAEKWVDRVVGLDGVRGAFAMLGTPDGQAGVELITFHSPTDERATTRPLANTPWIRHIAFVVEDIEAVVAKLRGRGAELVGEIADVAGQYRLCCVRGPEGIILELAKPIA